EEVGQRAEPVLATPLDRWRWMGSHLLVATVGSIVLAGVVGLGFGLTAGATTGEWSWIPLSIGAAFSHLPALAVVAGVAVALFGLLPRLTSLAWVMIAVVWVGLVGVIVGLPEWVSNLSPFGYGALVPAVDVEPVPLLVLSAIAVVLMTVGFLGFRRRDVGVG
ncbi:MAG: ABC transporter permease, partial [Acidimicrobiia bacterium]